MKLRASGSPLHIYDCSGDRFMICLAPQKDWEVNNPAENSPTSKCGWRRWRRPLKNRMGKDERAHQTGSQT